MSDAEVERVTCVRINEVLIEHLDEDWAVPCDNEDHEQRPEAQWILHWVCCATDFVCTDCKDQVLAASDMPFVDCDYCGKTYTPALAALRLIEPLNRRPQ